MKVAVRRTPDECEGIGARWAVVGRVAAGTLSLGSAAAMLGVSYPQMKRIAKQFREAGARGLCHGEFGRRMSFYAWRIRGGASFLRNRGLI